MTAYSRHRKLTPFIIIYRNGSKLWRRGYIAKLGQTVLKTTTLGAPHAIHHYCSPALPETANGEGPDCEALPPKTKLEALFSSRRIYPRPKPRILPLRARDFMSIRPGDRPVRAFSERPAPPASSHLLYLDVLRLQIGAVAGCSCRKGKYCKRLICDLPIAQYELLETFSCPRCGSSPSRARHFPTRHLMSMQLLFLHLIGHS